jgi:NhaP-type Na+/H+ or K+/H+ antiporter
MKKLFVNPSQDKNIFYYLFLMSLLLVFIALVMSVLDLWLSPFGAILDRLEKYSRVTKPVLYAWIGVAGLLPYAVLSLWQSERRKEFSFTFLIVIMVIALTLTLHWHYLVRLNEEAEFKGVPRELIEKVPGLYKYQFKHDK